MSAGTTPYRLFKRTAGKRTHYYARILDPETGRVVRTVCTKETNYERAVHWMDDYLKREHDTQTAKNLITVEELSKGYWKKDAQYARGRLSRGKSISNGQLDISEDYTRNFILLLELLDSAPVLRASEIRRQGIDAKTAQRMVETGSIRRVARGIYARIDLDVQSHHGLVEAQMIVESGVVCLLSALSFHEIGTRAPRQVWMAVARGSHMPRTTHQPLRVVTFSGQAFTEGVEKHEIEGISVRVYTAAKTVADCFKYRNKLGTDVAVEALRDVVHSRKADVDELLRFADICRVRNVMTPYLESIVQ